MAHQNRYAVHNLNARLQRCYLTSADSSLITKQSLAIFTQFTGRKLSQSSTYKPSKDRSLHLVCGPQGIPYRQLILAMES